MADAMRELECLLEGAADVHHQVSANYGLLERLSRDAAAAVRELDIPEPWRSQIRAGFIKMRSTEGRDLEAFRQLLSSMRELCDCLEKVPAEWRRKRLKEESRKPTSAG